jgi:hypothetical protein
MGRRSGVPLLALATGIVCLAAAVGVSTAQPAHVSARAPLGGLNIVGVGPEPLSYADQAIAQAHALHAQVVRSEVPWSNVEPLAPGQYSSASLAFMDRLVSDAASVGIKVVMTVDHTPCWASSAPASLLRVCHPDESSKAETWPPREPSQYATFMTFLAERYGSRLAALEVWNEPDQANEFYFAGPEKPARYAAILRAAYPAIKQVDPSLPVLAGSLVGSNGRFLRALYAAGIKGYYDGLSVHFYNLVLGSLRSIHEVQLANGDSKPVWLNEFGWTSCLPQRKIEQEQACVTQQTQAQNLTDTYQALARTPWVAADIVYKLQGSRAEEFGVLTPGGRRKPSFAALSRVLGSPFGSGGSTTLSLTQRSGHILASGSGPVGDFMELEAYQGQTLRYRALFTLDRYNHYSLSLPSALGQSGLRVRVFQYWAGPGRAAQRSI